MLFLKYEKVTAIVTLTRGGVRSIQSILQFTQLYCYIQHIFLSAVSFLKSDAFTAVDTLIRGVEPKVQILLQFAQFIVVFNIFEFQLSDS